MTKKDDVRSFCAHFLTSPVGGRSPTLNELSHTHRGRERRGRNPTLG